jgi:hypothetical protein
MTRKGSKDRTERANKLDKEDKAAKEYRVDTEDKNQVGQS